MISLATSVSTRVSNELGANRAGQACESARVSLALSVVSGCIGGSTMVAARGVWGDLFSHDKGVVKGVKKAMLLMALVEVFNFPVTVCGGIVRGTGRPRLGMYASLGGFYFLTLPLGVVFAFKLRLGLAGFTIGLLIGIVACLILLLTFIVRINWVQEATKAQTFVCIAQVQEQVPRYEVNELVENHENDQKCPLGCDLRGDWAKKFRIDKMALTEKGLCNKINAIPLKLNRWVGAKPSYDVEKQGEVLTWCGLAATCFRICLQCCTAVHNICRGSSTWASSGGNNHLFPPQIVNRRPFVSCKSYFPCRLTV
ncbi:hypothetical protein JHK84_047341 [Glycine max]|nr:hypothetical protein JHK84_047341 [Glycine max]